jgi:iron(III) transport system substrate-binding protein
MSASIIGNRRREAAMSPGAMLLAACSVLCALLPGQSLAQSSTAYQPAAWEKILAAAKKEGLVRYYTVQLPAALDRTVAGFRKAHPDIAIESFRGAAGTVMPRADQERASNADGADVMMTTDVVWLSNRAKEGALLAPAGPAARNWPAQQMGGGGRYAIVGYELFVIPYNKTLARTPPKTYADLLKPEFKGRLGTIESASQSLAAWYDWLEKANGAEFLSGLKAQNPKLYVSGAPIAQAVASGEIAASAFATVTAVKPLMDAGAPMDFVVPNPSFAASFGMSALSWAKRPNAGLVFMDYVMSVEGQTAWHGTGESASVLKGIPGSMQAAALTPFDAEAYPADVVKKYNDRWNRIFK